MLEHEARGGSLGIEVSQVVAAIQTEAHDEETIVAQVCGDAGECRGFGAWREVRHHVAGTHRGVKRLWLALRTQIEFGQVGNEPDWAGMIGLGRLNQLPIGVDTNHDVAASGQCGADSSRPATGVQQARPPGEHRIEQSCLPVKVHTFGGHPAEPFDVPLGMTWAVRRDPARLFAHSTKVAGHAAGVSRLD